MSKRGKNFTILYRSYAVENFPELLITHFPLISATKLNSRAATKSKNVTGFDKTCDGLRKNLGRLVISP